MRTITVTAAMKSCLDFISIRESAGNYNAVIGNAHATQDLGALTIDDIYALQKDLVRNHPSGAIGRYQFINKTLGGLIADLQVPRRSFFTPALQDMLGAALLIRRGWDQWWRSTLSDQDFLHRLSCEWASLPDPYNGGKSHYDGDGINHAGQTLDACYAALKIVRAAGAGEPTGSPAPDAVPAAAPPAAAPELTARDLNLQELARLKAIFG